VLNADRRFHTRRIDASSGAVCCGTVQVGFDVAFGGLADALQRLLHAGAQVGASVAAAVQVGDDEPAEAGDGSSEW
jgi:hypothetical protein